LFVTSIFLSMAVKLDDSAVSISNTYKEWN
jgi:hypothetical protein